MSDNPKRIWFEAKEYGYGAGLPASWEGWVVFISYLVLLMAGCIIFAIQENLINLLLFTLGLTAVVCVIAVLKSPKFRWRWGYDDLEQMSKRQAAAKRRQEAKKLSSQVSQPVDGKPGSG
jgi:hypothetical protein